MVITSSSPPIFLLVDFEDTSLCHLLLSLVQHTTHALEQSQVVNYAKVKIELSFAMRELGNDGQKVVLVEIGRAQYLLLI